MSDTVSACPFHADAASLPGDGTPLRPSPTLAQWRSQGAAVPLAYQDGHEGLVGTRYDFARAVLEDPRFSMRPERMPMGPTGHISDEEDLPNAALPAELPGELDEAAQRSELANLLVLDGAEHSRLRRLVTPRFSIRQVRGRREWIAQMVSRQLTELKAKGSPADVWADYGLPIAARTHCHVIGVPDSEYDDFVRLFEGSSTAQQKYDFIRRVLEMRRGDPGDDVVTDLLAADAVPREEVEGLLRLLLGAGRDSVAYLIATATVALLTDPGQLDLLRAEPERFDTAIEEFMRVGAMFVTLFPRTALEDVEVAGVAVSAGQSVSVSPVAANRDPDRWEDPEQFDLTRDAYGHLGFGHGIHGCIGQQLARVEIREGIRQLIEGCPGLRLVHADQLTPMPFAHPVAVYEAGSVIVEWD
jgi:cytochrome P450